MTTERIKADEKTLHDRVFNQSFRILKSSMVMVAYVIILIMSKRLGVCKKSGHEGLKEVEMFFEKAVRTA